MTLLVQMDLGLFLMRLGVGIVFLYHAYGKLKGPGMMAKGLGWKSWQVTLLGLVEAIGALSVALGVYAPYGAGALALVMIGAIYYKTMKWKVSFSPWDKTGWEFDLTLLAVSLAIFLGNVGAYALFP